VSADWRTRRELGEQVPAAGYYRIVTAPSDRAGLAITPPLNIIHWRCYSERYDEIHAGAGAEG